MTSLASNGGGDIYGIKKASELAVETLFMRVVASLVLLQTKPKPYQLTSPQTTLTPRHPPQTPEMDD